jgi:hypothetical protein
MRRQEKGSIGIALFAALVLALQSAFAVAAPPVQRDIFGNVICTEGSGGQMPAGGGHDGGHKPDCRMLACSGAFQAAADLSVLVEWPATTLASETVNYLSPRIASPHDRRTPANPRAPPLIA